MKNFLNRPARKLFCILSLILVCAAIIPAAFAADISFSTDQKDYYFLVNETATIPVTVTSTYTSDVSGMLETATTELLSKPDMMMTRSISKGYLRNITPGTSAITLSAGTSAYAETISVDLNFDYFDKTPMQVKLPRVVVHFVTDMSQAGTAGSPVTATSTRGGNGVGSPTTSSITLIQQPIPQAVQQSSLDPGGSSASSSAGTQAGQVSQGNQNASALQQQLQQASASPEENRTRFLEQMEADPLVQAANASLLAVQFSRTNLEVNPVSGDAGTFSLTYTGQQGGVVQVTGEMKRGSVQMLTEETEAALPAPSVIGANATYLAYILQLGGSGYRQVSTEILRTPDETSLSAAYASGEGKRAFVNATESRGAVTRVTLDQESGQVPLRTILIAAGILAVFAVLGYLGYRKYLASREIEPLSPEKTPTKPAPSIHPPVRDDTGTRGEEALFAAELAFSEGRPAEAYGLIGQAFRNYISRTWGDGNELTDDEARAILHARDVHLPWADEMLGKCSLIEFAKGSPDAAEFRKFAGTLRDLFRKKE
ncbi:MAG: hypothetical protein ABFC24_07600 [Methanoregulaceae archaeon]